MDKYRIESHKLIYHLERLAQWQRGEEIAPIYLEVSPSGTCNHRCRFCAKDFMNYQKVFLPPDLFCLRLKEMGEMGVKSIMYGGEGEPLLHPALEEFVAATTANGIDAALSTNGVLMTPERARRLMEHCSWIKVSINAGSPATYAKLHGCRAEEFATVMHHVEQAANLRAQHRLACTIGMQILLLPENAGELAPLARQARDIGADYLVVKPYSQHPKSHTQRYRDVTYQGYLHLADELQGFNSQNFQVIFRTKTMRKWDAKKRPYPSCLALPFWAYIDAKGNVWGCSSFLLEEDFRYGNLLEHPFADIWQGEKKKRLCHKMAQRGATAFCRNNCRMDEVNRFLWDLAHPPTHVNFI